MKGEGCAPSESRQRTLLDTDRAMRPFVRSPVSRLVSLLGICLVVAGCEEPKLPAMTPSAPPGAARQPRPEVAQRTAPGEAPKAAASKQPTASGTRARAAEPLRPAAQARTADITFDHIKFDMEKGEAFDSAMLNDQIRALSGQPIRIRGYIHPGTVFTQTGIRQFVLVRDNMECCFGPGAMLYDAIVVEMKPGRSTDFTSRPITVEGTFSVREVLDSQGKHLAIYHLQADSAG